MPTIHRTKRHREKKVTTTPVNNSQGRENPNRQIYGTHRWRKLSEWKRNQNPLCEECLTKNKLTPAKVVDHPIPINQGGDPWDETNLRSLCISCHNAKSGREAHQRK